MDKTPTLTTNYARYVLVVLLCVYVSNQWARYLLNYLYAVSDDDYDDDDAKEFISIEDATGISTSEYGLLVGYGFSFCYVICGLFMGRAADLYNRKLIIFYGLVIWNVATVCLGMSENFIQLLLSRILLGIGESFSMPASYSLIADYFPAESLAQANGVFAFGVYVGGGLSSLSIAMAQGIGWRASAFTVAGYGLLLSLLVRFTVREPARTPAVTAPAPANRTSDAEEGGGYAPTNGSSGDAEKDYTARESTKLIFGDPLIVLLIFGGMVRFMAGYAIGSYLPDFFSQIYPNDNTIYSYLNASVVSVGGALSSYAGGYAADRWEKAGQHKARMYIPAIGALLGAPTFFLVIVTPNFYAAMFFLFVEYLVAECWFGPAISVLQKALPPRVRGVGIGYYSFFTTIAGSFMSYIVGVILDAYTSDAALKITLLISVCGMYLLSGAVFLVASRYMPALDSSSLKGSERQPLLDRQDEFETDDEVKTANRRGNAAARRTNSNRETF
ncbi:unnamed protein product [Ectocarpus sp. 13 AM-2016]